MIIRELNPFLEDEAIVFGDWNLTVCHQRPLSGPKRLMRVVCKRYHAKMRMVKEPKLNVANVDWFLYRLGKRRLEFGAVFYQTEICLNHEMLLMRVHPI